MSNDQEARNHLARAKELEAAGDLDGAIAAYTAAHEHRGELDDPHFDLELAMGLERMERAVREQTRITEQRQAAEAREIADIWFRAGEGHAERGRWQEAANAYQQALALSDEPRITAALEAAQLRLAGDVE